MGAPDVPPAGAPAPEGAAPAAHSGEIPAAGAILRGTPVAPGLVLGGAHRKDQDLARVRAERVPLEGVDAELNRFRSALEASRAQLGDLRSRLEGRVPEQDARILDTHLAYLRDSVFIADVENLILKEQMGLEAAISKVVSDFDRIFRLVQSETLRQSAVDLRDVGLRVLRNLGSGGAGVQPERYVLVARELSIVDMFNLENERVLGIVTQEGGLTSHAAIFARAMRIPTLTGVSGLLDAVREGDFLILDASEGVLRVNPEEVVRQQYARSQAESAPDEALEPAERLVLQCADGREFPASAVCGNLPEVEAAVRAGFTEIGLYRTELLYLVDRDQPTREQLVRHYRSVVELARGARVTFRLLNVDSGLDVKYLYDAREQNPALGRAGVRQLLAREGLLRRQIQALLLACEGAKARVAVPLVIDCDDLRRVKEVAFEERIELRKSGERFQDRLEFGCVIETPAALLGARDLLREAEFGVVGVDSLTQYLLAADRENPELAELFDALHPVVLRALIALAGTARELARPLSAFGALVSEPGNAELLVGTGLRSFVLPPSSAPGWSAALRSVDPGRAQRDCEAAARAAGRSEAQSLVGGYRHGFARS
jgi:phosphotransferase system enzyme I (PtsI)